jgi:hypothetical protein
MITLFRVLLISSLLFANQAVASENITLNLPVSVIADAISAIMPLNVNATSQTIQGKITIISIKNLQLTDNHLNARLHLAGDNLEFVTEVAGHQIRLKVGSVELDFNVMAQLRFDAARQTLFIKPIIDEVQAVKDASGGDVGHALVSLLNDREFPVSMKNIDPLMAKTGTKTLIIATRIADVRARKDLLQLSLAPKITAK